MTRKLIRGALIGVGLVVAAFVRLVFEKSGEPSAPADATSLAFLSKVASVANATAPTMVDSVTELMNVHALPGVLVYNYRFITLASGDLDTTQLVATLRPGTLTQACSTPATRDGLLKRGVSMRFSYSDSSRKYLTAFDVTPAACGF